MREPVVGNVRPEPAFISNPCKTKELTHSQSEAVTALRAEFVVKPGNEAKVRETIELILASSFCRDREFLQALVLVSEMESRLITVLTFWQSNGFAEARERRVARMRQKLQPLLDQCMRVQSFTAHLMDGRSAEATNQIAATERVFSASTEAVAIV